MIWLIASFSRSMACSWVFFSLPSKSVSSLSSFSSCSSLARVSRIVSFRSSWEIRRSLFRDKLRRPASHPASRAGRYPGREPE